MRDAAVLDELIGAGLAQDHIRVADGLAQPWLCM